MNKNIHTTISKFSLPIVIVFCLIVFMLVRGTAPIPQNSDIKSVRLGGVEVEVELAISQQDQAKGLSGRESLAEDKGMLFIFSTPGKYFFWMQGMNFPIDMIWINENMEIIYMEKNVSHEDYMSTYGPDQNAQYVLEVVSGFSDQHKLQIGDKVIFNY